MRMFDIFNGYKLNEEEKRWDQFIDDICNREMNTLSEVQKNAVLCFWYDTEMQSGGHSGYFDVFASIKPEELEKAILAVSYKKIVNNYKEAVLEGEKDDFEKTDNTYYEFSPSLQQCLRDYVEKYKDKIFES